MISGLTLKELEALHYNYTKDGIPEANFAARNLADKLLVEIQARRANGGEERPRYGPDGPHIRRQLQDRGRELLRESTTATTPAGVRDFVLAAAAAAITGSEIEFDGGQIYVSLTDARGWLKDFKDLAALLEPLVEETTILQADGAQVERDPLRRAYWAVSEGLHDELESKVEKATKEDQ